MRATTSVARKTARAAACVVVLACTGSTASAQDTRLGFAVGAGVPVAGIGLQEPALSVSGWLARPIRGPYGWRVEAWSARLLMPDSGFGPPPVL